MDVLERPILPTLSTCTSTAVYEWRRQLAEFQTRLVNYRARSQNHEYGHDLRSWVTPEVWLYISQRLLLPEDRITADEGANDDAVEDFLRQRGRYQQDHRIRALRPTMTRLTSTNPETIIAWREELNQFLDAAHTHQSLLEPTYTVDIRDLSLIHI